MSGFYRGAVGDWFGDAITAVFTDSEPRVVEEPEALASRNAIENPRHGDFAYVAYRLATDLPCGFCSCAGCYGCTPDAEEACGCGSKWAESRKTETDKENQP